MTEIKPKETKAPGLAGTAYIFYALGVIGGGTALIGLIFTLIGRDSSNKTWTKSHHTWQCSTFFISLFFSALYFVSMLLCDGMSEVKHPFLSTSLTYIGCTSFFVGMLFYIYRIGKGIIYFLDEKPINSYKILF